MHLPRIEQYDTPLSSERPGSGESLVYGDDGLPISPRSLSSGPLEPSRSYSPISPSTYTQSDEGKFAKPTAILVQDLEKFAFTYKSLDSYLVQPDGPTPTEGTSSASVCGTETVRELSPSPESEIESVSAAVSESSTQPEVATAAAQVADWDPEVTEAANILFHMAKSSYPSPFFTAASSVDSARFDAPFASRAERIRKAKMTDEELGIERDTDSEQDTDSEPESASECRKVSRPLANASASGSRSTFTSTATLTSNANTNVNTNANLNIGIAMGGEAEAGIKPPAKKKQKRNEPKPPAPRVPGTRASTRARKPNRRYAE